MILAEQLDKGIVTKQAALERLAEALPVARGKLKKCVYEISNGHDIYFAYGPGRDENGHECIHALWGSLEFEGMAQTLQYAADTSQDRLRSHIVQYAESIILKNA